MLYDVFKHVKTMANYQWLYRHLRNYSGLTIKFFWHAFSVTSGLDIGIVRAVL